MPSSDKPGSVAGEVAVFFLAPLTPLPPFFLPPGGRARFGVLTAVAVPFFLLAAEGLDDAGLVKLLWFSSGAGVLPASLLSDSNPGVDVAAAASGMVTSPFGVSCSLFIGTPDGSAVALLAKPSPGSSCLFSGFMRSAPSLLGMCSDSCSAVDILLRGSSVIPSSVKNEVEKARKC